MALEVRCRGGDLGFLRCENQPDIEYNAFL